MTLGWQDHSSDFSLGIYVRPKIHSVIDLSETLNAMQRYCSAPPVSSRGRCLKPVLRHEYIDIEGCRSSCLPRLHFNDFLYRCPDHSLIHKRNSTESTVSSDTTLISWQALAAGLDGYSGRALLLCGGPGAIGIRLGMLGENFANVFVLFVLRTARSQDVKAEPGRDEDSHGCVLLNDAGTGHGGRCHRNGLIFRLPSGSILRMVTRRPGSCLWCVSMQCCIPFGLWLACEPIGDSDVVTLCPAWGSW
jgi:hypothetical protein